MDFEQGVLAVEVQHKKALEKLVETTVLWSEQVEKRNSDLVDELRKSLDCYQEQVDIFEKVLRSAVRPRRDGVASGSPSMRWMGLGPSREEKEFKLPGGLPKLEA